MASRWKLVLAAALYLTAAGCDAPAWSSSSSALTHDSVLAKAGLANYWQLDLQLPPGEKIVKLILIEENLYCLTGSNWLLAVDAASGVRKWSRQVAEKGVKVFPPCHGTRVPVDANLPNVDKVRFPPLSASLPARDLVLVNTPNCVMALDRMTGEEVRKISFAQYQPGSFVANTGGGCDGTFFYVGTANGDVKAIRINEGVVAWSYQAGSIMCASPQCLAVTGTSPRVYVATGEGDYAILKSNSLLLVMWPMTGARRWHDMSGGVLATFHVDDRAAFIPCVNQRVYAFGLAGGEPLWRFTAKGQLLDDVQVSENSVFQYSRGDKLYALDVTNGKCRWSMRQGRRVLADMPSNGVPTSYLVDDARNLLVVDEILGKIRVTIPLTGVSLFADNTSAAAIYLGNAAGRLVCLRQIGAEHLTPDMLKKAKAKAKAETKAGAAKAETKK